MVAEVGELLKSMRLNTHGVHHAFDHSRFKPVLQPAYASLGTHFHQPHRPGNFQLLPQAGNTDTQFPAQVSQRGQPIIFR